MVVAAKCPECGAPFSARDIGKKCGYCGIVVATTKLNIPPAPITYESLSPEEKRMWDEMQEGKRRKRILTSVSVFLLWAFVTWFGCYLITTLVSLNWSLLAFAGFLLIGLLLGATIKNHHPNDW